MKYENVRATLGKLFGEEIVAVLDDEEIKSLATALLEVASKETHSFGVGRPQDTANEDMDISDKKVVPFKTKEAPEKEVPDSNKITGTVYMMSMEKFETVKNDIFSKEATSANVGNLKVMTKDKYVAFVVSGKVNPSLINIARLKIYSDVIYDADNRKVVKEKTQNLHRELFN